MKNWFVLLLVVPLTIRGQTRHESWFKLNMAHRFSQHWTISADLQHRRQANYRTKSQDLFKYPLGNYVRVWAQYNILLLSPFGYFQQEELQDKAGTLKISNETRFSAGASRTMITRKMTSNTRLLLDARFIEQEPGSKTFQPRYRLRQSFSFPFIKQGEKTKLAWLVWEEVLFRTANGSTGFDQNRIYNAFQRKFKQGEISVGYQWILQQGSRQLYHRDQLYIVLNTFL